jgi:hypothetical protein
MFFGTFLIFISIVYINKIKGVFKMNVQDKYIGEYECSFGEEAIFTLIKRGSELLAGGVTNAGFYEEYNWEYDNDFTLDENLSEFIEYINESEIRLI